MVVREVTSLKRWSVSWKENGNVTEVVTLMEGERSSEGQRWSV